MHKINTYRLQQRLQQLRNAGKKNAAVAQEVSLRLTTVLEKLDSEKQPDVNVINRYFKKSKERRRKFKMHN